MEENVNRLEGNFVCEGGLCFFEGGVERDVFLSGSGGAFLRGEWSGAELSEIANKSKKG